MTTAIWTDLSRNLAPDDLKFIEGTAPGEWLTQDQGTSTILVAALDPKLADGTPVFMSDCQFKEAEKFATDELIAERLWQLSEKLTGAYSKRPPLVRRSVSPRNISSQCARVRPWP